MKVIASILTIGIVVLTISFNTPPVDAQERQVLDLRDFNAIDVGGNIDVDIHQGQNFLVELNIPEDELDDFVIEVNGSTLEINRSRGAGGFFGLWGSNLSVDVTLPELEAVRASGGANVSAAETISGEILSISASGGSEIDMHIEVTELEINTSGGSDVYVRGTTESAQIKTSGGSDLNAGDLNARKVHVQTSGGSDTYISVVDRIEGTASGGSDIVYTGNPQIVDVNVSGGSDVTHR